MKKLNKIIISMLIMMLFFQSGSIAAKASDSAVFYVQTAQALSDGTIQVSIYLDGVTSLGGLDAELFFNPEKVTFVKSSIGKSLNSSLADINYDAENSSLHYVVLYPDAAKAHGIIINAIFQLKEGDSYQPELRINELVDNSDEINDIPYTIKYQQSDGTWEDSSDESGTLAKEKVIDDTLEEYGAAEDKEQQKDSDVVSVDSNNNVTGVLTDSEAEADQVNLIGKNVADNVAETEETETELEPDEETTADNEVETETETETEKVLTTQKDDKHTDGKKNNIDRRAILYCFGLMVLLIIADVYKKWKKK